MLPALYKTHPRPCLYAQHPAQPSKECQQVRGPCTGPPALTRQGSGGEANPGQGCTQVGLLRGEDRARSDQGATELQCCHRGIFQPPVSEAFNSTVTMASKTWGNRWQCRLGANNWIPLRTSIPFSRRNTVRDSLQLIEDGKGHLKASMQDAGSRRVQKGGWCSHGATQHCWRRTMRGSAILLA